MILMDPVDARKWAKREKKDIGALSKWMKSVRSLLLIGIKKINGSMSTRSTAIFKDQNVANGLVNESFYIDSLIKE